MTSYCDIKNAYNNSNDELDKMARMINNKNKMVQDVEQDKVDIARLWNSGINQMMDKQYVAKGMPDSGYYSSQGDWSNMSQQIGSKSDSSFSDLSDVSQSMKIDLNSIDTFLDNAKSEKNQKNMINYIN